MSRKKSLLDVQKSLYTEMSNMGKDLGKTLVDGIKNGTKTADFMESIRTTSETRLLSLLFTRMISMTNWRRLEQNFQVP